MGRCSKNAAGLLRRRGSREGLSLAHGLEESRLFVVCPVSGPGLQSGEGLCKWTCGRQEHVCMIVLAGARDDRAGGKDPESLHAQKADANEGHWRR